VDELERSLRELLTDERLDVPLPPGAVGAVHAGVRRRRAATRAVLAVSAVVAVLLGASIAVTGSGLPHKAKVALGGDDDPPGTPSPPATVSSSPMVSKPPSPQRIAWNPRPYDGNAFAADVAACQASQLRLSLGEFQGATGAAAGGIEATNTGAPCRLDGSPVVVGLAAAGTQLTDGQSALDDEVPVSSATLPEGGTATALVVVYGDTSACLGPVSTFRVEPVLGAEPVALAAHWVDGGDVVPRCGSVPDDEQQNHYRLAVGGWEVPATRNDPAYALPAALRRTPTEVMQGTELRYQVMVQTSGAMGQPCQPFRERLVSPDGSVVASETYLLPCREIQASAGDLVYLTMRLQVPPSAPVGDLRLEWQVPTFLPVQAAVTVTAAPPPCRQDQLRFSAGRGGAAAGTYYNAVVFTNVSDAACSLYGYPGVEFVGLDGRHLPTKPEHMTDVARESVVLAANGGKAAARLGSSPAPNSDEPCEAASGVDVIAPGLTRQVLVRDVASYCSHGRLLVWPVASR
jgi:hypothetical protein